MTVRAYVHIRKVLTKIVSRRLWEHTIGGTWCLRPRGYVSPIYDKAFAPAVQGRALIAAGTGGFGGRATVAIWTYAGGRTKHGIPFVTIQRVIPAVSSQRMPLCSASLRLPQGLTWSRILVNSVLFFLCCAWLVHFFTREGPNSTQGQPS